MKHIFAFALVMSLAASALAQPARPAPVGEGPDTVAPAMPGRFGLGPSGLGPFGPGPLGEGPAGAGPQGPGPLVVPPIDLPPLPPMPVIAEPFLEHLTNPMPPLDLSEINMAVAMARLAVDRVALDVGQERTRDREAELREREREREQQLYAQGHDAVNDYRWDRALTYFNRVIELKGARLDAALYWKAYSQNRLGQRSEALGTIAELTKGHPNSSYRKQAAMLEAEVRRDIGQPVRPQDSADDEVKLMALQALQNTAPEEAIPILEKMLDGTASPKLKRRALFVLAQSPSPRAREVLRNYAKGGSTPELQNQAIQYLGVHGGPESRATLEEVYTSTPDVDVKRRILRAYMVSGEKSRLLKAAQGEQNPELRGEAVRQLGAMSAHDELWQLYQKETSVDVKRQILRSMHAGGSVDRLIDLAKTEQNPDLRKEAVRTLGLLRSTRTADVLLQIYASDTNLDVRKSVINALFLQENATALVALARKERDTNLQKEIVGRLSHMRSKEATAYMIELLGK